MRKYWQVFFLLSFLSFCLKALADEVKEKTDGFFVGENVPKPVNSSFIGDISKSMDKDLFVGENTQQQTDNAFVGANTINTENTYFLGDNSQKEEDKQTDAPFVGDKHGQ